MAIPDPVALSERAYLLPGSVNCLLIVQGDKALAVDTGLGKDGGRRVRRACEHLGAELVGIVTTHAHADHFGGHAYLLRQRRVPVWAPPLEAELIRAPRLEPVYLCHGAAPPPELMENWLMAEPSPVDHLAHPGSLEVDGIAVTLHDVGGHSLEQIAVEVDDVLFVADAVFGAVVLEKYALPFAQDAGRQLRSAAWVAGHGARLAVPGHGDPAAPAVLGEATLRSIERLRDTVLGHADGVEAATLLRRVCTALGVPPLDLPRWHLAHTTLQAHLWTFRAEGRLHVRIDDHRLLWETT